MNHIQRFFIVINVLLLFSCLSVETELVFDNNGSGTARFIYSVSTLAVDISKIGDDNLIFSFPIMEEQFDIAAQRAGGIQILNHEMETDGTRYYINSEIAFESFDSLSLFSGSEFLIERNGANTILTVILYRGSGDREVDGQALEIVKENFNDDAFSFKITIPGDIIRVNGATFSGSDVFYNIKVENLMESTDEVQFSVEYR